MLKAVSIYWHPVKKANWHYASVGRRCSAIIWTIRRFAALPDRFAAWLLAPYLAWVSFAAVLNLSIWWLNR